MTKIRHIGQVFVVVKKAFWNGLGDILLEEALTWQKILRVIRRLELSAFRLEMNGNGYLYKDLGFEIEGLQKRSQEGIFLVFYLMGKLID